MDHSPKGDRRQVTVPGRGQEQHGGHRPTGHGQSFLGCEPHGQPHADRDAGWLRQSRRTDRPSRQSRNADADTGQRHRPELPPTAELGHHHLLGHGDTELTTRLK